MYSFLFEVPQLRFSGLWVSSLLHIKFAGFAVYKSANVHQSRNYTVKAHN